MSNPKNKIRVQLKRKGIALILENMGIIKPKVDIINLWVDPRGNYLGSDMEVSERSFEAELCHDSMAAG